MIKEAIVLMDGDSFCLY